MIKQLLKDIESAAREGEIEKVTRLTTILGRAKEIAQRKETILQEEKKLEELVRSHNGTATGGFHTSLNSLHRGTRGGLIVDVTLPKQGRIRIEEATGAETLVTLIQCLIVGSPGTELEFAL